LNQGDRTVDGEQLTDGQLEESDGRWRLRFARRLPHRPEKVWQALTVPEHLSVWFPTDIEGERAKGAPLKFRFHNGEGPTIEGRMLTYDPPRVLELLWGDEETLRFELDPVDGGTLLTFVNTLGQLGKAARDAAGWHACLDVLASHLDGQTPSWTPTERWSQVHKVYVDRFGPDASTIGPPGSATDRA
jgi:uncharacterized protein YndB with AHSA1/START domain